MFGDMLIETVVMVFCNVGSGMQMVVVVSVDHTIRVLTSARGTMRRYAKVLVSVENRT